MKSLEPSFHYEMSRAAVAKEMLPLEIGSIPRPKNRKITGTFMDRDLTVRAVAIGPIRSAPWSDAMAEAVQRPNGRRPIATRQPHCTTSR